MSSSSSAVRSRSAARAAWGPWGKRPRLSGDQPVEYRAKGGECIGRAFEIGRRDAVGAGIDRRDGLEQLADGHAERAGEAHEHVGSRVGLGEFDTADVFVTQSRELGET